MRTQTRVENKLEKSKRLRELREESGRDGEASIRGSASSDRSISDNHDPVGVRAYAAQNATTPLGSFTIQRREVGNHDVQINILYASSTISVD